MRLNGYAFTRHAISRALEMAVSPDELRACILRPEQTYIQRDKGNAEVRQAGRIAIVADTRGNIMTVVYRRQERWSRDDLSLAWGAA